MPTLTAQALRLHPDRLLPAAPELRSIARRLYDEVRDLPILSPHGHVEARLLLEDQPFPDPTTLLVTPDHYVTRLLHASGVPLDRLGVGQGPLSPEAAREAWRLLCENWSVYRGTPVKYWLESALVDVFGLDLRPSAETADALYDGIADQLAQPAFRPRALFDRFRIEVLATTDDPADDLAAHAALRADPTFTGRVVPTFRPDRYLEAGRPDWARDVLHLGAVAGIDTGCYAGWVAAMEDRRTHFRRHGGVSTDHSHEDVGTEPLDAAEAERIYREALAGTVEPRPGDGAAQAHAAGDGPDGDRGRPHHDAAPRGAPRPPPADGRSVRAGHRPRPAAARRLHRRPAAAARPVRHPPEPHARALHARRVRVLPRARPARRLLPVGVRRRALVVPRRTRRHPPLAVRRLRDRRPVPHQRVHRRHPGDLLDPRPPRHGTAARRRATWPALSRTTDSTRTRRPRPSSTWCAGGPPRCSGCSGSRRTQKRYAVCP